MHGSLNFLLMLFLFAACNQAKTIEVADTATQPTNSTQALANDTLTPLSEVISEEDAGEVATEYETFHILTIGEGYNYDSLSTQASQVAQHLHVKVDNLERIYDSKKGIIVPDNSDDEVYRGEYYPRRFADPTVSIEMNYAFADSMAEQDKKMIIVAGIYEKKSQADSVLALTKATYPLAKVITKELFIGCMH